MLHVLLVGQPGQILGKGCQEGLTSFSTWWLSHGGWIPLRPDPCMCHITLRPWKVHCHSSCSPSWGLTEPRRVYILTWEQTCTASCKNQTHEIFWSKFCQFDHLILANLANTWRVLVGLKTAAFLSFPILPPVITPEREKAQELSALLPDLHGLSLWPHVP